MKLVRDKPDHVALAGDGGAGGGLQVAGPGQDPGLPDKQITIEAWVRVHQPLKWGGIVSALQDNGSYERGFILGYMENNGALLSRIDRTFSLLGGLINSIRKKVSN